MVFGVGEMGAPSLPLLFVFLSFCCVWTQHVTSLFGQLSLFHPSVYGPLLLSIADMLHHLSPIPSIVFCGFSYAPIECSVPSSRFAACQDPDGLKACFALCLTSLYLFYRPFSTHSLFNIRIFISLAADLHS